MVFKLDLVHIPNQTIRLLSSSLTISLRIHLFIPNRDNPANVTPNISNIPTPRGGQPWQNPSYAIEYTILPSQNLTLRNTQC